MNEKEPKIFEKRHVFKNKNKNLSPQEKWRLFLVEYAGKDFQKRMLQAKCN
jgi:hypothetical protein